MMLPHLLCSCHQSMIYGFARLFPTQALPRLIFLVSARYVDHTLLNVMYHWFMEAVFLWHVSHLLLDEGDLDTLRVCEAEGMVNN